MNYSKKLLFIALCLATLFLASSSRASVTIKGKTLDEIDDIVSIATDGGTAEMKKFSLGVLANETDTDGSRNKSIYVQRISGDNTASETYKSSRNLQDPVQVESGIHAAASSLTTEEGRAVLYVDYSVITSEGYMRVSPYAAFVGKDGSVSSTKFIDLHVDHEKSGIAYDQDIDGGIFLQNDTNEYFAVAMLKNSHSILTGDLTCSANIFIIGMNLSGDQVNIFDTGVIIEKDMKQGYSPVSVAVGDFMGTGTTD